MEDRKLLELVQIFQNKISKMDKTKYLKNHDEAVQLRLRGNEHFAKNEYDKSIELYSEASLCSPLTSEELALAIANRSAAYYHLKKYKESLEDIDLAIQYGYPVRSRIKLVVRRSACEAELNKVIKNLEECSVSETSQSCAGNLKVLKSESGRGLFTTENIPKGSLVLIEKPFASVLHPSRYNKFCYHCLKSVDQRPFPCNTCRQVRFCSSVCATRAWDQYHKVECCFLDLFNVTNDFHYSPKLTLRALVKTGVFESLAVSLPEAMEETEFEDPYRAFCSLIQHPKEDTNDYSIASAILVAFILEKYPDHIFTKSTISDLSNRIVNHLRQVNVNAITITAKEALMDGDTPQFQEHSIGCGVYLLSRNINHSCDPNTRITCFDRDSLLLHALEDIPANKEILFSYGGNYKWQIMSDRKRMLLNSYFFDCNCSACANGLQPHNNALLCPDCKGPVVSDGPMTCQDCKKSDHLDLKQLLGDTEACLKMVKLGQTFLDTKTGDKTDIEAAEKAFQEALQGLESIMYPGHSELSKVAEKLVECSVKLEKYDEAVKLKVRIFNDLKSQYDISYFKVWNCLFQLVTLESKLYLQLKGKKPLDKNRINTLKTDFLQNLDLLESTLSRISSETSAFRAKIQSMRKTVCN